MAYIYNIPVLREDIRENIDRDKWDEWGNNIDNRVSSIMNEFDRIDNDRNRKIQEERNRIRNKKAEITLKSKDIKNERIQTRQQYNKLNEQITDNATKHSTIDTLYNVSNIHNQNIISSGGSLLNIAKDVDPDTNATLENTCNNNGVLKDDGQCLCNSGFDPKTFCKKCLPEWGGESCNIPCDCNGNGECIQYGDNTRCICKNNRRGTNCERCLHGWAGKDCDIECSCNSDNGECDGIDGIGVCKRCFKGYYGINCDQKCDQKCYNCNDGINGDGKCNDDDNCDPGFYGELCENKCFCKDNEICNDGIYGDGTCKCPEGFDDETCTECKPGYFGLMCQKCNDGCKTCNDGLNNDGKCTDCKDGFHGPNCVNRVINTDTIADIVDNINNKLKSKKEFLNNDQTVDNLLNLLKENNVYTDNLVIENLKIKITRKGIQIIDKLKNLKNLSESVYKNINMNIRLLLQTIYAIDMGVNTQYIFIKLQEHDDKSITYEINIDKCVANKKGDNCDKCSNGYEGSNCESCKVGWGDGTDIDYGDFKVKNCVSCSEGIVGDNCHTCPDPNFSIESNCNDCKQGFTGANCDQCEAGYFGPTCNPCACTNDSKCNDGISGDGSCKCNAGYSGINCQYSDEINCSDNGSVKMNGTCECNKGWDGKNCGINTSTEGWVLSK